MFKKKHDADGNVERFKARLVSQGYNQKFGADYNETFSPVVRFESVRTMIALAAEQNLELHQIDVTTAFLNGELKETIYMKQPEGFLTEGKENLVCELKHSIYGLKQSPRCWNETVDKFLKELDFTQSLNDPCIYINNSGGEVFSVNMYSRIHPENSRKIQDQGYGKAASLPSCKDRSPERVEYMDWSASIFNRNSEEISDGNLKTSINTNRTWYKAR